MEMLWRHSRLKQALCGGMIALYLSVSLGLLPSPGLLARWLGHGVSEAFPCQAHGCGCASAHECWTSCCCYTPHQRLTWAIRHGVRPPAFVRYSPEEWRAAEIEAASASTTMRSCPLCETGIAESLCGDPEAVGLKGACCDSGAEHADVSAACGESTGIVPRLVPSISPLTCKGLELLLAFAVPATHPPELAMVLPPALRLPPFGRPEDRCSPTRTLDVASPPPRCA